ncbi:MAG: DUF5663 domain-containing protein [bacterium]|nr:DUF5663 domain-containing protein [bacterium]MDZ4296468.1 DUF5663 domain-containing protein [Patescibacteria group bacterium]
MADDATKMNDATEEFLERLLGEKDLSDVDPEVRAQMKNDLRERLEDRINAAILAKMPTDKLEEFERLLENTDPGEVQSFCQTHVPNLPEVVAEAMLGFRQTYLNI